MIIRKLNDAGVHEFQKYIVQRREGLAVPVPTYLLEDEEFSADIDIVVHIEKREFESRYDMGYYLADKFECKNIQPLIGDIGFWTWIALFWFEQLCPLKDGHYAPSKDYNYVLSNNFRHRPRHSIYMTWQLVSQYGENAKFMLCKDPSTRGEITEQMMGRQEILSSKGVIELASLLYFNPETGAFKRGAAARKSAGCVARFVAWLQQLQLTYDIFSLTKEELCSLLPNEFSKFIELN